MQPNLHSFLDTLTFALKDIAHFINQHDPDAPEHPDPYIQPNPADLHYDDIVIVKKDYLILTCWILALPTFLLWKLIQVG